MDLSEREALEYRIACELDKPSVYINGPTAMSRRKAKAIMDLLPASGRRWKLRGAEPTPLFPGGHFVVAEGPPMEPGEEVWVVPAGTVVELREQLRAEYDELLMALLGGKEKM